MGNGSATNADAFTAAAATGELGIDPHAAQEVLNKIRGGKEAVDGLIGSSSALAQGPKLGANEVGKAISMKFTQRVDGGNDSYAQALRNLRDQYQQAEDAIVAAIDKYQQVDQTGASALSRQNA